MIAMNPANRTRIRAAGRAAAAMAVIAVGCPITQPAWADSAKASVGGQAVVVNPASLFKTQDLNFGRIAPLAAAGTIIVDPATRGCSTGGAAVSAGGCKPAEFAGRGARKMRMRITLPATITLTGPAGATMTANAFTADVAPDIILTSSPGNSGPRYEITSDSGIFTFRVGAKLNVKANQPSGVYNGTFTVKVQYQ